MLQAAVELADVGGIEALSMRRLAKELGVEAMSLYNHVANKDEILAGIVDLIEGEIEVPSDETDWKAAIRRSAISARDVYVRHAWASGLQLSRQGGGDAGLRRADWLLRTLREAGLSQDLVYHAYHVLQAYILGFTVQQLNFRHEGQDLDRLATGFLQRLPAGEFLDFVDHVKQHLEPRAGGEGGFELGLDLILEGLERARDAR